MGSLINTIDKLNTTCKLHQEVEYKKEESSILKIVNKFFKKEFPFVIDVSGYSLSTLWNRQSLVLDVYVSPEHFCELMDNRVEKIVVDKMRDMTRQFIKTVIPEWNGNLSTLNLRFFPSVEEATILRVLEDLKVVF